MEVSINAAVMLDPRGDFLRPSSKLAPRMATIKGKKILLFDNTQIATFATSYGPIFPWLSTCLQERHGIICTTQTRNLLSATRVDLTQLADEIAASDVQGVVIALSNGGITQPTSLFAAELESKGKPCVQICTTMGLPLAGITAYNYAPGLPIILLKPAAGDKDNFGKEQASEIVPEIIEGLTGDQATLMANFRKRFAAVDLRISENGVMRLPPAAAALSTQKSGASEITVDPGQFSVELYEELCAAELGDGLPVVPPTQARVDAMLEFTDLDPAFPLVEELPPSGAAITIRALAVNAVMAGCKPEYFPIIVTAFQAMSDPIYRLFQGAITTHPAGNAIIISGPLADEIGVSSGPGCLGPGYRANATIGRAINLTIMNVSRSIPGKSDLAVFGSPAEFSYCFAESDQNNPWQPIHTELYSPEATSVTMLKCEGPHNVLDPHGGPEGLLKSIAATAATPGGNNSVYLGQLLVILNRNQARDIARAGWGKRDVREFLFETARHPIEWIQKLGARTARPAHHLKLKDVPVMHSPNDVILAVAGGPGHHAMVGVPWGLSQAVTRPVTLKNGSPLKRIRDIRKNQH